MSRTPVPQGLREKVSAQAKYRCGYCLTQEIVIASPLEMEHLVPESHGGLTVEENLWLACWLCNRRKSNRIVVKDEGSGELVSLFNPRTQDWREHFCWSEEGDEIDGLTAIGRATIQSLNLNDPYRVHSRRIWVDAGWHPPKD